MKYFHVINGVVESVCSNPFTVGDEKAIGTEEKVRVGYTYVDEVLSPSGSAQ